MYKTITRSLNVGVYLGDERVFDGGNTQSRERGRSLELVNILSELMTLGFGHQIVDSRMGKAETVETFDQTERTHILLWVCGNRFFVGGLRKEWGKEFGIGKRISRLLDLLRDSMVTIS